MLDMVNKDILPAVSGYIRELATTLISKKSLGVDIPCDYEAELVGDLSALQSAAFSKKKELENYMIEALECPCNTSLALFSKDKILSCMTELRILVDELETKTHSAFWPYPSYGDILFSVK